jgi:DNA replication protein DnaC
MYFSRRETPPREHLSDVNLSLIGIPRLYREAEIDDFKANSDFLKMLRNYIKYIHDMFEDCVNLTLYGSNGSGKTYIASILLKNAYRNRYSAKRITFAEFMDKVFDRNKLADEEKYIIQQEINNIYDAEFLVIDELGKENNTKSESNVNLLINLLKYREEKGLPTIICTNLSLKVIKERYGETVDSMISQSIRLEMAGDDMRNVIFRKRNAISKLMGEEDA